MDYEDDYAYEWDRLGLGNALPDGMSYREASNAVRPLWFRAIRGKVSGHPFIVNGAFFRSMWGPIEVSGKTITFDDFEQFALAGGVDYMIEAWLSGVPVDYIIAD